MFGFLKKKLKESVQKLTKKVQTEEAPKVEKKKEIKIEPKIEKKEKHFKEIKTEKKPGKIKESSKPKKLRPKEPTEQRIGTVEKEIKHIEEEQEGKLGKNEQETEESEEILDELPEEEAESIQEPIAEPTYVEPEEKIEEELHIEKEPTKLKRSFTERFFKKITVKTLENKDIDDFFEDFENDLLQANVALDVVDFLKKSLKKKLVGKDLKRGKVEDEISKAFEESLIETVKQGEIDLERKLKEKKPQVLIFLGFNGAGKTTSVAKLANYLKSKGHSVVLAAGDTWRAAAQEQLEHHGNKIGVNVIKHQYGADSAAVIFDAVKHAQAKGIDFVIGDTAGRTQANVNLMDELKKVCRVNKPDLKILVVDSLTGNDAVEQAIKFNEAVGVDAVVLTKVDVDEKGGAILSVCYAIKKPILFLGMGQKYEDFEPFDAEKFVKNLME